MEQTAYKFISGEIYCQDCLMEYLQWLDIPNEEAEEYIIISITEPTKCAKCHKLIADLKND